MPISGYSHNSYQINTEGGGGEGRIYSERGKRTQTNRALNLSTLYPKKSTSMSLHIIL